MPIDKDWVSGTSLRLEFPILDDEGTPLPIPGVQYPDGEHIAVAEWTFGNFEGSEPLLRVQPTRVDNTTLLVEIPPGVDVPAGLYSHQLFLTLEGSKQRVRKGTIRVLGSPPTGS